MEKTSMFTFDQGSKEHRTYLLVTWAAFAVIVILTPYILQSVWGPFQIGRMNRALVTAVAILGLNLVIGYSGLIALGHSAFMGLGAFTTASLVQDNGWGYFWTIPISLLICFIVGTMLGVPALRIKGLYLALVTVAFAVIFPSLAKIDKWGISDRTGGVNGKNVRQQMEAPSSLEGLLGISNPDQQAIYRYFVIAIISCIAFLLTRNLIKSRSGRAIIAIRDNEIGAAVSGVNLPLYKVMTFGVSAALGGLAGSMLVMDKSFAAEQDFTFVLAVDLLVGLVIGGVGTLQGGLYGALVVVFVREFTKNIYWDLKILTLDGNGPLSQVFFGVLLIVFTFYAPGGLASLARLIKSKFVQIVPQPPAAVETAAA